MGEGATDSAKTQKGNELYSHIQRLEMIYADLCLRQVPLPNRQIISTQMFIVGGVWECE